MINQIEMKALRVFLTDKQIKEYIDMVDKLRKKKHTETVLKYYYNGYKEKVLKKVACEICGGSYAIYKKKRHKETKKHKKALNEKKNRDYYQNSLLVCDVCNGKYSKYRLEDHCKSKKHWLASCRMLD